MMKSLVWNKRYQLVFLITLVLLLSACQATSVPESTLPSSLPATESPIPSQIPTPVSHTPTETPVHEPPPPTPTATMEISPGQVTPGATPQGEQNLIGWIKTDTAVLRTVDGGASWEEVTPDGIREVISSGGVNGGPWFAAAFSEGDYALAAYSLGSQAVIYRTTDGGQNWNESMLELQEEVQGITSMELLGQDHGWLLATRGFGAGNDWVDLYYSMDGGASWRFLSGSDSPNNQVGGISSGGIKSGLSFSTPKNGWLTGSAPIETVYLFRTQDGGLSWQPYHLPLPEGASFSGSSFPPIFFDEQNGVLPVTLITLSNEPGLLFYETQDAGENWVPTVLLEGQLTAWDWIDTQHGFAAGTEDQEQSKLYLTKDGGKTWEAYPLEMAVVRSLDFISEQAGWAICGWAFEPLEGCSGDLYHTQDGGRSWERVYP